MKRKITWMCILALLANNIFFLNPADVRAEEGSVDVPAQINEEAVNDVSDVDDERPEGVESVLVPTEAVEPTEEGGRPEGIEPVLVPTEAVEPTEEGGRPEGIEPVLVPTEPSEPTEDSERPEGVEPVNVPTEPAAEEEIPEGVDRYVVPTTPTEETVSDNEPESVSSDDTVSDDTVISENEAVSGDSVEKTVSGNGEKTASENAFSVEFPEMTESDNSLDFIIDPYGLIKETKAARYGGKRFQEGTALFFTNKDEQTEDENGEITGEIHYSDTSDPKTIKNTGDVAVNIKLSIRIPLTPSENGGIGICEDPSFAETDVPAAAISLRDDKGDETYVSGEGDLEKEYVLEPDEDLAFALHGVINSKADWGMVTEELEPEISWEAEPVVKEEEQDKDEEKDVDAQEEIISENETVSGEEITEDDKQPEDSGQEQEKLCGGMKAHSIFEGRLDEGVCAVGLPIYREDMYRFKMDPQKLIDRTNGAAYPGMSFEKGQSLYFRNADRDAKYDYSSTSDLQTIVNKGIVPVKISVSLSIADGDGVMLSSERDFRNYPMSQIFLSIVSGNGAPFENTVYTNTGVSCEMILPGVDKEVIGIKWEEGRGYSYIFSSDDEDEKDNGEKEEDESDGDGTEYPRFDFRLTGSTNEEADWEDLKEDNLSINVIWTVQQVREETEDLNNNG